MAVHQIERKEPTLRTALAEEQSNPFAPPRSEIEQGKPTNGKLLPYQKAGRVIRLMAWLGTFATVVIGIAILLPPLSTDKPLPLELVPLLLVAAILAGVPFLIAAGVLRHATWGRYTGIAYGLISLFAFPLGTIVGLYVLAQLVFGWAESDAEG